MANDSKRVSQLGITTTLATTDRVVVLKNPSSTPNTQTITVNNFINSTINNFPYANTTQRGVTKIDGTSITTDGNGVISTASLTRTANGNFFSEVAVDNPASVHMTTQTTDNTAWAVVYTQFASANNLTPNIKLTTRTAASQNDWIYDQAGSLTFPDSTIQNTAFQKVTAPATSTSTGTVGQIAWDTNYIYICVSSNVWKRVAINLTSW